MVTMSFRREDAWDIVTEFVHSESLRNHMLAVEAGMRAYAQKYDADAEKWGITGLLHDFDWEIHPDLNEHPVKGAPILRERGVPEDIIRSILSHGVNTGVPRDSLMDKVLYAVDELTGLIIAVALVRPSQDIRDVKVKSIKKKWKDKSFAAGAHRESIEEGCAELGVDLWEEHVPLVLSAMQEIAPNLGLAGQGGASGH
ncbi:MAG: HDIG domain-containing protein [Chloroflexi bacterium]|nr:HDIG domain-containing protein [Chloroflexota bacterium]